MLESGGRSLEDLDHEPELVRSQRGISPVASPAREEGSLKRVVAGANSSDSSTRRASTADANATAPTAAMTSQVETLLPTELRAPIPGEGTTPNSRSGRGPLAAQDGADVVFAFSP